MALGGCRHQLKRPRAAVGYALTVQPKAGFANFCTPDYLDGLRSGALLLVACTFGSLPNLCGAAAPQAT
jgi:hypothetical protein